MIARRAVVFGRVQGVGFRFFAERAASETGVVGWVRNRPDGAVETVVEGDAAAVARYLERLRSGPPGSRVSSLVEEEVVVREYDSFEITR
ncbi:MAG TPA: acylphosphatase [Thermoanaerobaculia bacterium]|nr:acylphosphatase [Thermoanaerobaculia bacterium]